ncbi:hypothetical protein EUTSA_v10009996mg [Eutrema salsugineum]|uniref:Uncharacterized protein n=1 Tax=Eutrema salsugineum TaxID=72664 RepID=V4KRE7_EUTSA|nr:hypothetical protein EUTSA_v10009996mg [Eutrema salsugineum]
MFVIKNENGQTKQKQTNRTRKKKATLSVTYSYFSPFFYQTLSLDLPLQLLSSEFDQILSLSLTLKNGSFDSLLSLFKGF